MSAGSPPLSETTVAPIQKHSVPVSNKPEVQETNHEEGQHFEKLLQKVWSDRELQLWQEGVWRSTFQVHVRFFFPTAGKRILQPNHREWSSWYHKPGVKRQAKKGYISTFLCFHYNSNVCYFWTRYKANLN